MTNEMTEKEAVKAFVEGAKKSSSCARELAAICDNNEWNDIAIQIDAIRDNGYQLSRMRAMTKTELEQGINMKINS